MSIDDNGNGTKPNITKESRKKLIKSLLKQLVILIKEFYNKVKSLNRENNRLFI